MQRPRFSWSWIAVAASGVIVFGLGLAGFAAYYHATGESKTPADLFYLTGQLFTMNSGAVSGAVPWQLEIARFTAPLVAAYAVLSAVFALFSIEFRRWTLRFRRGHIIVCGLGKKGGRLVEELRQEGRRVVVIEPDEHNPGLSRCHELGVIVIPGRSDDDWTLARAQLSRAALLITTAGDDSVNIDTAVRAHDLTRFRTQGRLHCVAHITDPALQQLLKSHRIFDDRQDPFDLELVNLYEAGARVMLERGGFAGRIRDNGHPRVCLLGLGHFGEAVLRRLLRDWTILQNETIVPAAVDSGSSAPGAPSSRLEVVIIDRDASAKERSIRQRYRESLEGVSLHFVDRDVRAPEFAGPELAVSREDQSFSVFFVCFDDDSLATLSAIRIRDRFGSAAPIVVRMTEQTGFARLMECDAGGCGALSGIQAIGFLDIACMRDLFLGGDREIVGRAFHEVYLEERRTVGDTPESNPILVPWHQLDETTREANRIRAAETRGQLSALGLSLVPCPDRPVKLHAFQPEHLDALAQIEHRRWLAEKRAAGWRYGPERDNAGKINPFLVSWADLPEAGREFNRATVRRLPAILARADFEIRVQ